MKRITLNLFLSAGVFCGALLATSGWQSSSVSAQTKKQIDGKSVATTDGTLICDCTAGGSSCKCIVDGGGGGDDELLLQ